MKVKALNNYVIVELKKQTTTTTKTKSGLYLMNQEKTDMTRDGDKVVTTEVTVVDVGPKADVDLKPGDVVSLNFFELQILPEVDGHIYGAILDKEIKAKYVKEGD